MHAHVLCSFTFPFDIYVHIPTKKTYKCTLYKKKEETYVVNAQELYIIKVKIKFAEHSKLCRYMYINMDKVKNKIYTDFFNKQINKPDIKDT